MRPRLFVFVIVAAIGAGAGVVLVVGGGHDDGDRTAREELVAERGAQVMPFDLEATTHHFEPTDFGGVQRVVADDATDRRQIDLIRAHLRAEVDRFRAGDFGDPALIHGHDMPGLAVLEANAHTLEITYRVLDDGAEVTYRSRDERTVAALHDWFAAQLADHGAHARQG
ncbi:MAG TPA: hypothetical protein VM262_01960 [Acidimicrobiales bacterium]|nr:hypothetical protein [Acidimicrobiales bacterium]